MPVVLLFDTNKPTGLINITLKVLIAWFRWQPVQKFESPVIHCATFPGPLYYMKLRKPGPDIPMEVQMALPHQVGCVFIVLCVVCYDSSDTINVSLRSYKSMFSCQHLGNKSIPMQAVFCSNVTMDWLY